MFADAGAALTFFRFMLGATIGFDKWPIGFAKWPMVALTYLMVAGVF